MSRLSPASHSLAVVFTVGALLLALSGCAATGLPLAAASAPTVRAAQPLSGTVSVMLPNDLRPAVEHKGSTPQMEYFIYLVFAIIDASRGSYVTSDNNFQSPQEAKDAAGFGGEPKIAAAVGEAVYSRLRYASLFQDVARLKPPARDKPWALVEKAAGPAAIGPVLPEQLVLNAPEQEAHTLQNRALATSVPAFSTDYLLRVHLLHLYSSHFATTTSVTVSAYNTTSTVTQNKAYAPFANAVFLAELYHQGQPYPIWKGSFNGSSTGPLNSDMRQLTLTAFTTALDRMVAGLVQDAPVIAARAHSAAAPH